MVSNWSSTWSNRVNLAPEMASAHVENWSASFLLSKIKSIVRHKISVFALSFFTNIFSFLLHSGKPAVQNSTKKMWDSEDVHWDELVAVFGYEILSLNEIVPNLFLTSLVGIQEEKVKFKKQKIRYAINLSGNSSINHLFSQVLKIPIAGCETETEDISVYFPIVNELLSHVLSKGKKIVVFCHAGVSRSPTIVLSYLNHCLKMELDLAFKLVRARRPTICLDREFIMQLYASSIWLPK